jgi:NAD(P)-dependent dehydrogenase (short-subunit alcohol dehydrogenase family)
MPKIVLITGTSSGIGLATAVAAARAGLHPVATMRDTGKAGALTAAAAEAGVDMEIRQLDITSVESVSACVEGIIADHGRLDAVVNNAGAGHVGTVELTPLPEIRQIMEVNYFGVVNVVQATLPHLRASGGRLVTVTSIGGTIGHPFNEIYCAAKFAVEGLLESLAPTAALTGVTVTIVEPGAVASDFVSNQELDPAAMIATAGPYAPALEAYAKRTLSQFSHAAQTPAEAAEPIVAALIDANPPFRLQTSPSVRDFAAVKLADLDGSAVHGVTGKWLVS